MITTSETDIGDRTMGQRRATMTAPVFQRANIAVRIAVDHDRLVHDGPREQPIVDFFGPCCYVPCIAHEGLVSLASHVSLPNDNSF